MKTLASALFASLVACASNVSPHLAPSGPPVVLRGTDGTSLGLDMALHEHPFTVVTFFSDHCPCQRAHDARLRELIAKDTPRGIGFLVVDSDESATVALDAEEARLRGYPIWLDDAGKLARAYDAEYATYSVVLNGDGKVVYRGGFDSDRSHLREDREKYLADAIDDVLAGHAVRKSEAKALGCALELR